MIKQFNFKRTSQKGKKIKNGKNIYFVYNEGFIEEKKKMK